jgi:hypothetical protein
VGDLTGRPGSMMPGSYMPSGEVDILASYLVLI